MKYNKYWTVLYESESLIRDRSIHYNIQNSNFPFIEIKEGGWTFKFTPNEMEKISIWWSDLKNIINTQPQEDQHTPTDPTPHAEK